MTACTCYVCKLSCATYHLLFMIMKNGGKRKLIVKYFLPSSICFIMKAREKLRNITSSSRCSLLALPSSTRNPIIHLPSSISHLHPPLSIFHGNIYMFSCKSSSSYLKAHKKCTRYFLAVKSSENTASMSSYKVKQVGDTSSTRRLETS